MQTYYLAIDIGASSGRHILGSVVDGKIVLEEIYRFPNGMVEKNGKRCWDSEALVGHVIAGMKKCTELGKIPQFMGIDTWGVDFALLDANGEKIGETVGYRDGRNEGMDKEVEKILSFKQLYQRTGIQKQVFNTVYQLMALKQQAPHELAAAETLLMMPDYLNYRLTGVCHQEYTNATTGALVNIETGEWDSELIEMLGYPTKLFGKLSMPGETVGRLSPAIREEVGYDLTVLHIPSHDTASAVLAVPMTDENALYISSGTWSLMGMENKQAIVSDLAQVYNLTNEGGYEKRYRFLKNIMGLWIIQSIKKEAEVYSFGQLADMAENAADTGLRIDVNDNAFLAPKSMIQAIRDDLGRQELPLDELLSCVYHSLAESYAATAKKIADCCGVSAPILHIVGGGSKDSFLNKLTAEASGMKVCAGPVEATAIGNLLCQLLADGVFATVEEAREAVGRSFEVRYFE